MKLTMAHNHTGVNLLIPKNEFNVVVSALTPQAEVFHKKEAEHVLGVMRTGAFFDTWNDVAKCRLNCQELGMLITCLAAESYGTVEDYFTRMSADGKKCIAQPQKAEAR